jgi:hypothetical protein
MSACLVLGLEVEHGVQDKFESASSRSGVPLCQKGLESNMHIKIWSY